jgi:elongation factor G
LKFAQTGDTLCSEGNPILLENMSFPQPVISVAIESETLSDREKLNETLEILSKEDPTFTVREDSETGQVLISGMGELHIDVLTTRIKDEFKLPCRIGSPHVTYRESVSQEAVHTERFEKIIGGKENVAELSIRVLPQKQGEGNIFVNNADCRNVSEEVLTAIKNGIENSFAGGIKYGYPCTDIRVELTSVKFDEETATPFAFEACAVAAFDAACEKAIPTVLEPIMNVDITCPKEFVGEAVSLVTMRGGMVLSMESKPTTELVHTRAPMVKMFGFSTSLRSVTQGRASFSMEFSHFELKPGGL